MVVIENCKGFVVLTMITAHIIPFIADIQVKDEFRVFPFRIGEGL
jgi:hypothetical protein